MFNMNVLLNNDERKNYISKICGDILGKHEFFMEKIGQNTAVDEFLDNSACLLLCIRDDPEIPIDNKIDKTTKNTLVFYKRMPEIVSSDNINDVVQVCSLEGSPLSTCYHALKNVFIPALFEANNEDLNTIKLRTLFTNIEDGLRSTIIKHNTVKGDKQSYTPSSLSGIMSIKEEYDYWDYVQRENIKNEKKNAIRFLKILKPLCIKSASVNKITDLDDFLEECFNALDDLWKVSNYDENRMNNLLDVIGNFISHCVQKNLKEKDLWLDSKFETDELLSLSIDVCNKWIEMCSQLTKIFWPNYSNHRWADEPHSPLFIKQFVARLYSITELRNIHDNICQILDKKEKEDLNLTELFDTFSGINPIHYNPYTEDRWLSAIHAFNEGIKPVEEKIGVKIKEKLNQCSTNTLQMLELFKKYRNLLQKDGVKQYLITERQSFLVNVQDYMNDVLISDFYANDFLLKNFPLKSIDLPDMIIKIMRIKYTMNKVNDIEEIGQVMLNDLKGYDKYFECVRSLRKELSSCETNCYNDWLSATTRAITDSDMSLRTEDPVVHFEDGKLMKVNYNPSLVKLIKEVNQLQLLGYKIPTLVTEIVDKAKLFMQQAKALEQVTHFHNTIGDRMIPSQRPMMLTAALELSKLVRTENTVTWSNNSSVDQYIALLQNAVERLATENSQLCFYHTKITEMVSSLIEISLLQQKNKWRDRMSEIRDIIAEVTRKFSNTKTWLIHWDHQIYKVLQYQYQSGLQNLNQHLPEIKMELIYRQQRLQFNPALEEIRMKYFNQLKRFIVLPLTFQGVSEASKSIFPIMVERNADKFEFVYRNAELLFRKLLHVQEEWIDRVALGGVDLENMARNNLKVADDWDMNFKSSKAWSQEIAKIINCEHKIECLTVSTAPVRSEIELHNNRYWDVLSVSLYASVMYDINTIEDFMTTSKKQLDRQPQSIDEIGNANETYRLIKEKSNDIIKILEETDRKNKVLASWTKERVSQVTTAKQWWNNFQASLDNQQFIINRQIESIKSKLIANANNLSSELENFIVRWNRLRPKETDLVEGNSSVIEKNLSIVKEKREEWNLLFDSIKKIKDEYARFDVPIPDFSKCDEFENEIKECEDLWGLFEKFNEGITELCAIEWIVFRGKNLQKYETFLQEWEDKLNSMNITPLTAKLVNNLQIYKDFIPHIKYLRGDTFSEKHWSELYSILNIPSKPLNQLTFGDFISVQENVKNKLNDIQELNNRATSEIVVRQALAELDVWEVETKFTFLTHTDNKGEDIHLIKDFKDILLKIGDNQCLLQSITGSSNYDQFRDRTLLWENKLLELDNYLRNLNDVQRKWLYLEPIFKNETMKIEKSRFERIDKDLRYILNAIYNGDKRVTGLCRLPNLKTLLETLTQQLSICQKSLNQYLEEKRLKFPRFYFLSDEDLLEILGQANKPEIVQSHLKKLFAGINSVLFDKNNIVAVKSLEGEIVNLSNSITISLDVENWLSSLSSEMRRTLKELLVKCLKDADPLLFPSQILCLAESISFTCRCEDSIKKGSLKSLLSSLEEQLETYTKLSLRLEHNDSVVLELKLKALIFDTIYHISVVKDLIDNLVSGIEDWHWKKRLRFYVSNENNVIIKMVDAEFLYSYEYQGNAQKLVHTPLTDKCYLTLTQAMHLGLGGNPYGPAGTGKTESVKALGRLFGRQVLVFNCDEGLDIQSLTRILIGLVKCGAWGCFDEFNRLEEATLSAVSTHIHIIQEALKINQKTISLDSKMIEINSDSGIFVTLNPAGRGYGGRQKLPDNLKQLFRPIAMSRPDDLLIAEVILYSEGFKKANVIAKKLVQIFDIAKSILSQQKHYDWGLRALKTVVGGCKTALKSAASDTSYKLDELSLVVQTLRLNTLSKLTYSDALQFDKLIRDVFQDTEYQYAASNDMALIIERCFKDLDLQVNSEQVRKCLELYEQLGQRMGVVIVGPSSTGKTTIRRLLKQALVKLGNKINEYNINPKSMSRVQLLGQIDADTRQWVDGVLSVTAQHVYAEPSDVESWIIFDGDVDPEWIESLNSVLDDNHLLTLPSGCRIQFGPNVHFLFETHSLQHASPATVSRMGIILLSTQEMDNKCLVESWLSKKPSEHYNIINPLIQQYFYKALDWIQTKGELVCPCSAAAIVNQGLSLLENNVNKSHFVSSLMNGYGSLLTNQSRGAFVKQILEWTEEFIPDVGQMTYCYYNTSRNCVDCYHCDTTAEHGLFVKTAQIKTCIDILKVWIAKRESSIIIGPQGCGKSLLIDHCAQEIRGTEIVTIFCSSHITPTHIIQKLSQVCMFVNNNNGLVFRPKTIEHVILHLKDLNLAEMDKWGSNILVSFLHQVLTYGGFYEQSQMQWVILEEVQFVCSLISCDNISPRFINCNRIVALWPPDFPDFQTISVSYLKPLALNDKLLSVVTSIIIKMYNKIKDRFMGELKPYYKFSLRDLCTWCIGMQRYSTENNQEFLKALLHEGNRIFEDRLINEDDKSQYSNLAKEILDSEIGTASSFDDLDEIVYIGDDHLVKNKTPAMKIFKIEDWLLLLKNTMKKLENEGEYVDHKLVELELAKIVTYVERVLSLPGGSLFLPGRPGFGRKLAVRVVAERQTAQIISPKMSIGYGLNNFKNDLRTIMQLAGLEDRIIYYIFEDFHVVNPAFLDFINSLLSSGEIPGLYQPEEFETMCSSLKDTMAQFDFQGTVGQFFTERIKRNIHIIILADFMHPDFNNRWGMNPIVFRRCQTIWFSDWKSNTKCYILKKLSERIISNNDDSVAEYHIQESMYSYFLDIHEDARKFVNVTPRHFTLFTKTFLQIKHNKEAYILENERKLKAGLSKLTEARHVVAQLKKDAAQQETKLAEKQSKANAALELITKTMQNASLQKSEMEMLKENMEKENKALAIRKKEIDIELADVEPTLAEARSAVGNIKSESLSEIRSLRAPPDVIRDILEGVLRLMGIQDTSWNSMKTFLAKRGVKEDIRCFDARSIMTENRLQVEQVLRSREKSFEDKTAKRASAAAAPLAAWVIANVKYSRILEKIRPLEMEQTKLQNKLKQAEDQILLLSSGLDDVEQTVNQLKEQLNTNTKEAAEIEVHLSKVQATIAAAEGLVVKLDDEFSRWSDQLTEFSIDIKMLPYNSIIAAAIIIYLSSAAEEARSEAIENWQHILEVEDFKLEKFLSSEQEQLKWISDGLPSDYLSVQNAIIVSQTCSRPILIDPSNTAFKWLQSYLSKNKNVDIIPQYSQRFYTSLEMAVRFGKALIIYDVTSIDPVLVPILRGNFVFQGTRKLISVGEKLVDFNPSFQLYLVTRETNLNISPDIKSLLTTVNFEITHTGLTQQLLRCALSVEKPVLENKRIELLKKEEQLKAKLFLLQENILRELASAQGNILDNKELLASLNETKKGSSEIKQSLLESEKIQQELTEECEIYKPIAESAATLYFSMLSLQYINPFYQISMDAFMQIYKKVFSPVQEQIDFDIERKHRQLIKLVYTYISRFIFKEHLVMFAMHIIKNMHPHQFQDNEWQLFTRELIAGIKNEDPSIKDNLPIWINKDQAFDVHLLRQTLPNLHDSLNVNDVKAWESFLRNDSEIPVSTLTPFQNVLVTQAFKPGGLYSALTKFCQLVLGLSALSPETLKLEKLLSETRCSEPILIIVSPGVDPSNDLRTLAKNNVGPNFQEIALGQGTTEHAIELLKESAQNGNWLILKNLHLMTVWLTVLEKEFRSLDKIHESFRLWLTSEPHPNFSSLLIKMCLKVTYETPQGIKRNLERTYTKISNASMTSAEQARAIFVLAWFHAIVQERRTYIPQGWCKFYEFNDSDFVAALNVVRNRFETDNKNSVKWNYIHGLCENAIYGGRIDNSQDAQVLSSYLRAYFNSEIVNTGRKMLSPGIRIPQSSDLREYHKIIQKLPDSNSSELFELPMNVDQSWQKKRSLDIINSLKVVNQQPVTTGVQQSAEWKTKISTILHLWKQLNQEAGILKMKNVSNESDNDDPVNEFVIKELNFAIYLAHYVHKSLVEINKTIRAGGHFNDSMKSVIACILNQQTPEEWLSTWDGSKDPITYIRSIVKRATSIMKMYKEVQNTETLLEKSINLANFFNSRAFLSIFKQYSARLYKMPLDELILESTWSNNLRAAKTKMKLENLLIEGAHFNSNTLFENTRESPIVSVVPTFEIAWIPSISVMDVDHHLRVPIYQTYDRENLITYINVEIVQEMRDKWIQRNVAIFLQE